ncbi:MAG: hypothetical protein K0Q67_3028, partial [Cellvibrio sp.]|nr:hypothetical protein [Cellvibrio sp.]
PAARISEAESAELRKHLLSGIPQEQRALIQNTPIMVLSDVEFAALTRSTKGQAVTMIIDGKPVIVMREGADPGALREEGIHALQAHDPQWAKHIGSLDEQHLANWDELPLDQQIVLYRNKVALELDAQQRMIASIEADIGNAKSPQEKAALQRQLEQTQLAHTNLSRRMSEVGSIDAMDVANIKAGFSERPQWLDQPARLFQKVDDSEAAKRTAEQHEGLVKKITGDAPLSKEQTDILTRMSVGDIEHLIRASGDDVAQVKRILDLSIKSGSADTAVTHLRKVLDGLSPEQRDFVLNQLSKIKSENITGMLTDLHTLRNLAGDANAFDRILDALPYKDGKLTQKSLKETAELFSQLAKNNIPVATFFRHVGHADDLSAVLVRVKKSNDPATTLVELIHVVKAAADHSPEQAATILKTLAGIDLEDFPAAIRDIAVIKGKLSNPENFNALLDVLINSGVDKARLLSNLSAVLVHIDPRAAVALVSLLDQISDADRIETLADIAMIAEHILPQMEKSLLGAEGTKLLSVMVEAIATQRNWRVMADDMFSLLTIHSELPDTQQNKDHIKKIMDYLLSARGDMSKVSSIRLDQAEGDVRFQSIRENDGLANLAGDITAAMKILKSSANPETSINNMVTRLNKEGNLAGGDPWRTYLGEQKAHWDALQKNNAPEAVAFVRAIEEATKNLGWSHEELGALREMMPWFTALAKAKGIDISDATAMAKLMQDVFDRGFTDFKTRNLSSQGKLQSLERAFREMAVEARSGIDLRNLQSVEELKAKHPEKVKELLERLGLTEVELMKRGDADVLLQHIATLVAREEFYTQMRDMAKEIGANGAGIKQNITEVAGEIALAQNILKTHPDFELAIPFGKGTGFDQVWKRTVDGRTEYIIGEAKGAGAELGNPAKGPQMSAEWVLNTLREMLASPPGSPEHQLAAEMMDAIRNHTTSAIGTPSPVRGVVVEESAPPYHNDRTTTGTGLGGYDFSGLTLPG